MIEAETHNEVRAALNVWLDALKSTDAYTAIDHLLDKYTDHPLTAQPTAIEAEAANMAAVAKAQKREAALQANRTQPRRTHTASQPIASDVQYPWEA